MTNGIQINVLVLQICSQFLSDPKARLWPYSIAKKLEIRHDTVSKTMRRLEAAGWLESDWEPVQMIGWRPRRRLYRITDTGRKRTVESLARLRIRAS